MKAYGDEAFFPSMNLSNRCSPIAETLVMQPVSVNKDSLETTPAPSRRRPLRSSQCLSRRGGSGAYVKTYTREMMGNFDHMEDAMKFAVGDLVEWTSQSAGIVKRKVGEVVYVVPPRERPVRLVGAGCGQSRDHESYVVRVRQYDAIGDKVIRTRGYWPRVSQLVAVAK